MPTVLVVDDSEVDRRLAGGLLKADPCITVEFANNGTEALSRVEDICPDIILTDLLMPDMNGIELVTHLNQSHPLIPVILITSEGNELLVVEALQSGAASYVPKRTFARDLLSTVHHVLSISKLDHKRVRLMHSVTYHQCSFILKNDASLIPPLVGYFQDIATQLGMSDETERVRIGVALQEALCNALYHGNLDVDSSLREKDHKEYYQLVKQRSEQSLYKDRRIYVRAKITQSEAVFIIQDEGSGFDPSNLSDPTDPANLEKVSGRGLLLMRSFADEIKFNDIGNEVTLIKRKTEMISVPTVEPS